MSKQQIIDLESLVSDMGVNAIIARHYLSLTTTESQIELAELVAQQLQMALGDWTLLVRSLDGQILDAEYRQDAVEAERLVLEMEVDALMARGILMAQAGRVVPMAARLRRCVDRSLEGWYLLRDQVAAS